MDWTEPELETGRAHTGQWVGYGSNGLDWARTGNQKSAHGQVLAMVVMDWLGQNWKLEEQTGASESSMSKQSAISVVDWLSQNWKP
jgi:hypothetical protein